MKSMRLIKYILRARETCHKIRKIVSNPNYKDTNCGAPFQTCFNSSNNVIMIIIATQGDTQETIILNVTQKTRRTPIEH